MKKSLIAFSVFTAIVTTVFYCGEVYAQNGDLCGGTHGNGEIISVGNNGFTLTLNDGGQKGSGNLIVSLNNRATIETQTGFVSVSDLKVGDHVTLVGDNHQDGTFSADAVVVCGETEVSRSEATGTTQTTPVTVRNGNPEAYKKVSGIVNAVTILLVGLAWLGAVTFLWMKKKKNFVYLLFFTIFFIYLYKVLDLTLLQFQSLLLIQHFVPNLMLNGFSAGTNVNLIPLVTLTGEDLKTSLLNILMMTPFGFGLPFITNFRIKKVVLAGLIFSILIEFLQLITGFMADTTFRVADINDLIFNTVGVTVGYVLFAQFILIYRRVFPKTIKNPILHYIAQRPQIDL